MKPINISIMIAVVVLLASCAGVSGPQVTAAPVTPTPEPTPTPVAADPEIDVPSDSAAGLPDTESAASEPTAADSQPATEPEPEPPSTDEIQAEALEACESAAQFVDEGNMDDALSALDRAYELLITIPADDDPLAQQARDDLRLLVAQEIVRIHSQQRTAAAAPKIEWSLEIPLVSNEHVQREIARFTGPEREFFLASYQRSGPYRQMILDKLAEAGMPQQLAWLPLIESGFKVRARSRASAVGMWQFIASTGLRFGMRRTWWVDERMDFVKATDGAIGYLTELHEVFGDWPKALAAYNCGERRVMRLERNRPDEYLDFWDLYEQLPRETRRYVPRFFATLILIEEPEKYGLVLPEPDPPLPEWTTVEITRSIRLADMDSALGLEKGSLETLNPELRHQATPKSAYQLRVPNQLRETAIGKIASIDEWSPPQPSYVTYRVRRGDTLSGIARRFGTSVTAIVNANRLRSRHRIGIGQALRIPNGSAASAAPAPPTGEEMAYTVRRGDSLYSIAKRYRTTVNTLKRLNNMSSNMIHPGQRLTVRPGQGRVTSSGRYTVRRGDTPSEIAERHNVGLSALLRANGLSRQSTIYPGQVLVIPHS